MTPAEYKQSRKDLGFCVSDWLDKLGIKIDTHKDYSSGKRPVRPAIANHINSLLDLQKIQESIGDVIKKT